ncbi:MAG: glutamate 5-kinase [Oscillospiraceae bacterium]|jgi:glutamate 5-kinase|nr:glutamate 5-kinase [Oscillospiraceae bacterium]
MRIVVKVGTSTLCHEGRGLHFRNIEGIARALADVKNEGYDVVLVSSGAIGAGVGKLNLGARPTDLRVKQAVASVGQCELMHIYDKFFGEYGAAVGQILLTRDDVERPTVRENLLGTFEALFALGVIPVVNENDAVAFEEIESEHFVFGDNDTLSAVVASLVGADLLMILSDIDGLFDGDPRKNPNARLIPLVEEITPELERLAGGVGSPLGTGGMVTKLQAARIAGAAGVDMVIVNGAVPDNIYKAAHGEPVGTMLRAPKTLSAESRKKT